MSALSLVVAVALNCAPAGHPFVTEVYYDAPGDDTGQEFVELWNDSDSSRVLAGLKLQAGDGAGPGRWTTKWTGGPGDAVKPHSRFVIGGSAVSPRPDVVLTLDLQNGPDGFRLLWPDGATEVVGWGALEFAEYYCGAPAPDVPGGQSLARIPDRASTGSNAGDFHPAEPSPGFANQRSVDAALLRHRTVLAPEQPSPGGSATLEVMLVNAGATAWGVDDAALRVTSELLGAPVSLNAPAVAPGETTRVSIPLAALREGRGAFAASVHLVGDEASANDADTLLARVGAGPLEITEIQFHPAAAEGEWVEVRNTSHAPLALEGFKLGDHAGAGGGIEAGAPLPAESLAVLAQDPTALRMAYPALDASRLRRVSPWAALNNSDDATGLADQVVLAETDGVPVDRVGYSASGISAGVTLERAGDTWRPSPTAGGTPLAPPRPVEPVAGGFRADPRRLRTDGETVNFAWELPWGAAKVTLELYDMEGHRQRRLAGPVDSGVHGERPVTLDALAPGLYLAVLRAESADGTFTRVTPLRVDGTRP
jgi:hypothetical protein